MDESFTIPSPEKLYSDMERDLLFFIILHLRRNKISVEEAKHLAKQFLLIKKEQTVEELLISMQHLGDAFPEAQAVYLKHAKPFQQDKEKRAIEAMREKLSISDIDGALVIAKGVS